MLVEHTTVIDGQLSMLYKALQCPDNARVAVADDRLALVRDI